MVRRCMDLGDATQELETETDAAIRNVVKTTDLFAEEAGDQMLSAASNVLAVDIDMPLLSSSVSSNRALTKLLNFFANSSETAGWVLLRWLELLHFPVALSKISLPHIEVYSRPRFCDVEFRAGSKSSISPCMCKDFHPPY